MTHVLYIFYSYFHITIQYSKIVHIYIYIYGYGVYVLNSINKCVCHSELGVSVNFHYYTTAFCEHASFSKCRFIFSHLQLITPLVFHLDMLSGT